MLWNLLFQGWLGGPQTTTLVFVYVYICSFQVGKWIEKIHGFNQILMGVSVAEKATEGSGEWK